MPWHGDLGPSCMWGANCSCQRQKLETQLEAFAMLQMKDGIGWSQGDGMERKDSACTLKGKVAGFAGEFSVRKREVKDDSRFLS